MRFNGHDNPLATSTTSPWLNECVTTTFAKTRCLNHAISTPSIMPTTYTCCPNPFATLTPHCRPSPPPLIISTTTPLPPRSPTSHHLHHLDCAHHLPLCHLHLRNWVCHIQLPQPTSIPCCLPSPPHSITYPFATSIPTAHLLHPLDHAHHQPFAPLTPAAHHLHPLNYLTVCHLDPHCPPSPPPRSHPPPNPLPS